ncbi:MAG: hypothetical protein J7K36_04715 [Archaeoglobaceae archaeon]|nr:hypothetical protein [Archaeoglobaceae archaeon]
MIDIKILKRLALFGSLTAKAASLVFLDELSGGKLLEELEKLKNEIEDDRL